jgi:type VI secretion system protein ImpJ
MGQALLPDHFYTQEQALREEFHLRLRLLKAPFWGVGSLQWDDHQLLKGIVSLRELSLILPSGTLIDIPGNAMPAVLNLSASGVRASVYLHVLGEFRQSSASRGGGPADEGIERIFHKIELSTDETSKAGAQSFKLAEVECSPDKVWSVRSTFIPPVVQIERESPFFQPYLRRMHTLIQSMQQTLRSEAQENHLAADTAASGRIALHGLYTLQALLIDLDNHIYPHPYELYSALRAFYIDLCIHEGVIPGRVTESPYKHDDLAGCFSSLLERLEEQARLNARDIPYKEFTRQEGLLVCELPRELRSAKKVFFLVQKPQVTTKIDLSRVKLASESRIHAVYEHSLRGIPYQSLEWVPFQHGLASSVEFYGITPGAEWDHAIREGKVVLFDSPHFQGARFYLYWRPDLTNRREKRVDSLAHQGGSG